MVHVIAHRGASSAAPENSIEAFKLARDLGSDWVELDARRTADDQVVVHHDPYLADGRVIVESDRADLPKLVCNLDDALDACQGMRVNIEIKNLPGNPDWDESEWLADAVIGLLAQRGGQDSVIISSFIDSTLQRVRALSPGLPTALLLKVIERDWDDLASQVASDGHSALNAHDFLVDQAVVEVVHSHGLEVNVWVVDDPARMIELIDMGVDGLFTRVPDVARAVLAAR